MKKPIGKKNIFVIPSWFPTIFQPLQGTFTKEQIEALEVYAGGEYRFIVSYWGFNDTEVSFYSLSDALKKIIHFTSKKNHHFRENGVHYIETPYLNISNKIPYFGSFDRLIGAHLKSIRMAESLFGSIDLIHAHVSYPAGYLSSKLSSILQIPYVITEHMAPFPFDRYKKGDRAIPEINEAILNASAVIAVSDAHAAQIESYDFPRPFVIPNLVNEDLFQPLDIQISKKPFRYFSLGHLEKRKGIHDLLVAVALWNPAQKDVKFGIGGTGEEFQALKLQAKELNVEHLIEWYGDMSREKVANYMQNCQAFVLPSYEESFGLVYAEAIACGKPVIATKCGGPESIVNSLNGKLVPVGDPELLSDALQSIYSNYQRYNSKEIRDDFERRFSRKSVTEKIISLYSDVLSNSS